LVHFFTDAVFFYCKSYNQDITVVSEQNAEVLNITTGRTYI